MGMSQRLGDVIAPFLPKLAEFSGGSLAYSVALMMQLMVGTIVFMLLALPFIAPGVNADPWNIGKPLLIPMLLPLGSASGCRARRGGAWRQGGLVKKVSNPAFPAGIQSGVSGICRCGILPFWNGRTASTKPLPELYNSPNNFLHL